MTDSYDKHFSIGIRPEGQAGMRQDARDGAIVSQEDMLNRRGAGARINADSAGNVMFRKQDEIELLDEEVVELDRPADLAAAPGVNIVSPTIAAKKHDNAGYYDFTRPVDAAPFRVIDGDEWFVADDACVVIKNPPSSVVLPDVSLIDPQRLIVGHYESLDESGPGVDATPPQIASVKQPRPIKFEVVVRTGEAGLMWLLDAFEGDDRFVITGNKWRGAGGEREIVRSFRIQMSWADVDAGGRPPVHGGICMGSYMRADGSAAQPPNCAARALQGLTRRDECVSFVNNMHDEGNDHVFKRAESFFGDQSPVTFGVESDVVAALGAVTGGAAARAAVVILSFQGRADGKWFVQAVRHA